MLTNHFNRATARICALVWSLHAAILISTVAGQAPPAGQQKPEPEPQSKASETNQDSQNTTAQSLSALPLDKLLELALSRSPAIRRAQVELAEAQIALEQVRQEVAREVASAKMAVEMHRLQIEVSRSHWLQAENLKEQLVAAAAAAGKSADGEKNAQAMQAKYKVTEVSAALRLERAKLSELENRLQYLTGEPAILPLDGVTANNGPTRTTGELNISSTTKGNARIDPLTDPNTAAIRKQLEDVAETPVTLDLVDMPLADAISYLAELTKVRFVLHDPVRQEFGKDMFATPITLNLGPTPFPAALAALQDQAPWLRIVVRPYGVLLTAERGEPTGSMTVEEFYRQHNRATTTTEAR